MVEYRKLFEMGDRTITDKLKLLTDQRNALLEQRQKIYETLDRLNYKIARYKSAGSCVYCLHCMSTPCPMGIGQQVLRSPCVDGR